MKLLLIVVLLLTTSAYAGEQGTPPPTLCQNILTTLKKPLHFVRGRATNARDALVDRWTRIQDDAVEATMKLDALILYLRFAYSNIVPGSFSRPHLRYYVDSDLRKQIDAYLNASRFEAEQSIRRQAATAATLQTLAGKARRAARPISGVRPGMSADEKMAQLERDRLEAVRDVRRIGDGFTTSSIEDLARKVTEGTSVRPQLVEDLLRKAAIGDATDPDHAPSVVRAAPRSQVDAWLAKGKRGLTEDAEGWAVDLDPRVVSAIRSLQDALSTQGPGPGATQLDSLAAMNDGSATRTLEITLAGRGLSEKMPQATYAQGDLGQLSRASLDLIVLTEHPEFNGAATVAQMLTPLKAAMDALASGGKLVLVIRGADSDSQFKRHARAAEVLDLKTSAIDLTALRARGLIITR